MKKFMLFILAALMYTGFINAQDTLRPGTAIQKQKRDRIHQEEHIMFWDGKLYRMQAGDRIQIQNQFKLKNGTTVYPDGSYQLQNGTRYQLQRGECLDFNGNRYKNQRLFNQQRMMTQKQLNRNRNMNTQKMRNPKRSGRSSK
jgi:hypothetical protein